MALRDDQGVPSRDREDQKSCQTRLIIMNNSTLESEVAATFKNSNDGILVRSNCKQQYFYKKSVAPR